MNQTHPRSSPGNRRQPLLKDQSTHTVKEKRGLGEVAGGTAAECAAICCCCPCAMMNLLILTVYKVPVGLCRKAWHKRGKRHNVADKNKGLLQRMPTTASSVGDSEFDWPKDVIGNAGHGESPPASYLTSEELEFENAIWDQFYGTGFWRTLSQRET